MSEKRWKRRQSGGELKNDIDRLKQEADIEVVVMYLVSRGVLRLGKSYGNITFVTCPNKLKHPNDKHPTNAYFRKGWNTVYCTVCGENMGAVDILMWCLNISFGEAADLLWELEGRPDWYYANRTYTSIETAKSFYISNSEMALLGISFSSAVPMPYRESKFRQTLEVEGGYIYQYTGQNYRLTGTRHVSLNDYLPDRVLRQTVKKQCEKALIRFDEIEKSLQTPGLFDQERLKVSDIASRASEVS